MKRKVYKRKGMTFIDIEINYKLLCNLYTFINFVLQLSLETLQSYIILVFFLLLHYEHFFHREVSLLCTFGFYAFFHNVQSFSNPIFTVLYICANKLN